MWHDGGAEDTDGNVEHFAIAENLAVRNETTRGFEPERAGDENFVGEAGADGEDERDDDRCQHAGKRLKKNRHQVAKENDTEQRVTELRATLKVSSPIAGVHVPDSDEITGTGKGKDFAEPGGGRRDSDRTMGFREGGSAREGSRDCGGVDNGINKFSHFS